VGNEEADAKKDGDIKMSEENDVKKETDLRKSEDENAVPTEKKGKVPAFSLGLSRLKQARKKSKEY
jgi:hypothetical protein